MPLPSCCLTLLAAVLLPAALWAEQMDAHLKPERNRLLAGSKVRLGTVLSLKAPAAPAGVGNAMVSLVLVLDHSGSMSETGKMEMVHVAGPELVDRLESSDRLGVVGFDTSVEVIRPLLNVNDADGIKRLIKQLAPGSSTNLGGGLKEGLDLFTNAEKNAVKRLLLLSDGLANHGETNVQVLAAWAKDAFTQQGLRVSTVGLGADYDERFLAQIAHGGGGEFYYVSKREELPGLFRRELEEGRQVTVSGLTITAHARDGGRLLELVGFPFTGGDEQNREVKLGDLFAKEQRSLLMYFEITVPDQVTGPGWVPADVELTWTDVERKPQRVVLPLALEVTYEESKVAESLDKDVHARVIETENYRAMDKAMQEFREGKREKALEILKDAEKRASDQAAVSNDAKLLAQAGQLAQTRREVEGLVNERDAQLYNTEVGLFGSRSGGGKRSIVARGGGSVATQSSVDTGLKWLAGQQTAEGSWDTTATGGAKGEQREATALALLAFLGAGHTENVGMHKESVQKAVAWLRARQQADGFIGEAAEAGDGELAKFRKAASHALATMALCEAAGMGKSPETVKSAQLGLTWLAAQHPLRGLEQRLADVQGLTDDDILAVFWCVGAARSGKIAGLDVPPPSFEEALTFFDQCEVLGAESKHRYRFFDKERKVPGRLDTACALLCRQFLGFKREDLLPGANISFPP